MSRACYHVLTWNCTWHVKLLVIKRKNWKNWCWQFNDCSSCNNNYYGSGYFLEWYIFVLFFLKKWFWYNHIKAIKNHKKIAFLKQYLFKKIWTAMVLIYNISCVSVDFKNGWSVKDPQYILVRNDMGLEVNKHKNCIAFHEWDSNIRWVDKNRKKR